MPKLGANVATVLVALAFIACVTWPFFVPGELLYRDMAVVEHFGFTAANFGGGDLPARNIPQDAVLALAPYPLWLVKGLLVASASAAAGGSWWLARWANSGFALPAVAVAVCNPYVVERLLQGHWSLVVAAWWLPLLTAASMRRCWWLAWLGLWVVSLTPTGLLLGLVTVLVCGKGRRLLTLGLGVVLSMPWVIPGIMSTWRGGGGMDPAASAAMFAPRAEEYVGTFGALLTLGGFWNANAVPESRHLGFALFGLVLAGIALVGLRQIRRDIVVPVAILAVCGLSIPLVSWLWPGGMEWVLAHVPGAGLLRDAQKFIILLLPLYVVGLSGLRRPLALAALALVVLQLPDAARSIGELQPTPEHAVDYRLAANINGRLTLMPDRDTLVEIGGTPTVDPWSKVVNKLESGALTVDGQVVDAPNPRWTAAMQAWAQRDIPKLQRLGVGAVVEHGSIAWEDPAATAPPVPWILPTLWLATPLLILLVHSAASSTALRPGTGAGRQSARRLTPKKK